MSEELGYFLQIVIQLSLNVDSVYAFLAALHISVQPSLHVPAYHNTNAIQVYDPIFESSHEK